MMQVEEPIEVKQPELLPEQEAAIRGTVADFEPEKDAKASASKKADDGESVQMVALVYVGLFGVLAGRLGEHWALTEKEINTLAAPTVAVIDKYYPNVKVGPEVALLSAVAMVVVPRVLFQLQDKEKEAVADGDQSEHPAR